VRRKGTPLEIRKIPRPRKEPPAAFGSSTRQVMQMAGEMPGRQNQTKTNIT
jgi:hypothetical protein